MPIIGADFLRYFGLLVDLGEMRLLARKGSWSQHLVAPSSSGLFATIGVVADRCPHAKETSASLPTVEEPSTPSLPTVEARGSSPSLQHVLEEFPKVLNTSKVLPNPTHHVEHFLVTEGRPGWKLPRRSLLSWRSRVSSEDPAVTGLLLSTW